MLTMMTHNEPLAKTNTSSQLTRDEALSAELSNTLSTAGASWPVRLKFILTRILAVLIASTLQLVLVIYLIKDVTVVIFPVFPNSLQIPKSVMTLGSVAFLEALFLPIIIVIDVFILSRHFSFLATLLSFALLTVAWALVSTWILVTLPYLILV